MTESAGDAHADVEPELLSARESVPTPASRPSRQRTPRAAAREKEADEPAGLSTEDAAKSSASKEAVSSSSTSSRGRDTHRTSKQKGSGSANGTRGHEAKATPIAARSKKKKFKASPASSTLRGSLPPRPRRASTPLFAPSPTVGSRSSKRGGRTTRQTQSTKKKRTR